MIKSYLIVMFVMCFLFSMNGEAKLLTTKEVKAIKTEAAKKKQAKVFAHKKAVKAKTASVSKPKKNKAKKQLVKVEKKQTKPRKVVRLDFDKQNSLKPKVKARKELKKLAKNEKSKKRSLKATHCADGHVVGHQAFCSTTAKAQLKKNKGRSLASKANENKKLK